VDTTRVITLILALAGVYAFWKITIGISFLEGKDFRRSIIQIVLVIWILINFFWPTIDRVWNANIYGAGNSQMAHDLGSVLGANKVGGEGNCARMLDGLLVVGDCEGDQSSIVVATVGPPVVIEVQPTQQPQVVQTFPKPERVTFLLHARFPDGSEQDICALEWSKSADGTSWNPNIIVLCNDKDEPGNETRSVSWDQLVITSGSPPTISAQPAMVVPPTPIPPPPPTPTPEPLSQSEWNYACSQLWTDWASRNMLATAGTNSAEIARTYQFVPIGTTWVLVGPGEWKSFIHGKDAEIWQLTSAQLDINYTILGTFARLIPNADDSGSITFKGQGPHCAELGFPAP